VAHQYLEQVDPQTLAAVFGNVGSMICFQVGSEDAEPLATQLSRVAGEVLPRDLANVPRYTAYARLLVDGLPTRPFTMETLPPPVALTTDRTEIVRRASQRRYARPAETVAQEIQQALAPS
jgi:hypothetical protein